MAGLSRLGVGLGSVINEELEGVVSEEEETEEEEEDIKTLTAEDFTDIAEVSSDGWLNLSSALLNYQCFVDS